MSLNPKTATLALVIPLLGACTVEGDVEIGAANTDVNVNSNVEVGTCGNEQKSLGKRFAKCGKSTWSATDAIATVTTEKVIVRHNPSSATIYVYNGGQLLGANTYATTYSGSSAGQGMDIFFSNPNAVESWVNNLDAGNSGNYDINVDLSSLSYERVSYDGGTASSTVTGYFSGNLIGSETVTWTIPDRPIE